MTATVRRKPVLEGVAFLGRGNFFGMLVLRKWRGHCGPRGSRPVVGLDGHNVAAGFVRGRGPCDPVGVMGTVLGGATHLMLFLAMTDLGIVQNRCSGTGTRTGWAVVLPGYGPNQVMVEGAFSTSFHAVGELLLSLAWVAVLAVAVSLILRRAIGPVD